MTGKITKVTNTSNILKTIWLSKGISRIEISKKLNIDKSTVTVIVSGLLKKNIIKEVKFLSAGPKGGRKPVILKINKSCGYIAGIELHRNFYKAALINFEGEIIYSFHIKKNINGSNITSIFLEIIQRFNDHNPAISLLGAGLAISGIVNSRTGEIVQSIPLNTDNLNIQKSLDSHVPFPVFVENDANACCWGELIFHKQEKLKNFLFLLVEFYDSLSAGQNKNNVGVGMGFVFNSRIHYGQNYSAGEFRSIRIDPDNTMAQLSIEPTDTAFINFAEELTDHVAFLANTLNLNHIFIGGDLEKYSDVFTPLLKKSISKNWAYKEENNCNIHYSSFGKFAAAYGAAGMMMNNLFNNREYIQSL